MNPRTSEPRETPPGQRPAADQRRRSVREQAPSRQRRHVFIAGCRGTGTSALALLLNQHPSVAIGFERFNRVRGLVEPFHFEPDVLCHPVATETDILVPSFYQHLARKFERGEVSVVGDKVPLHTADALDHLHATFPDCRIVVNVRELEATAASFRARAADPGDAWSASEDHRKAADAWNEALETARRFDAIGHGEQLLIIPYDEMFDGQRLWLEVLLEFLQLSSTPTVTRAYEEAVVSARARAQSVQGALPPRVRKGVLARRDEDLEAWWRHRIAEQAKKFRGRLRAADHLPPSELNEITMPIPSEVRNELFDALKAPSKGPDKPSELERRVGAQMHEVAERGKRLSSLEQELAAVRGELGVRIDELQRAADAARKDRLEADGQAQAERERLEADLEATRTERTQALERLSAAQVASQGHRKRLEAELGDARAARASLEELNSRLEELQAADLAERRRLETELEAARADINSQLEQLRAQSQAALAEVSGERERLEAELASERERLNAELEAARVDGERRVEQLRAESQAALAAVSGERERLEAKLASERERLGAERERLGAERERLEAELAGERERLGAELEATRVDGERRVEQLRAESQAALAAVSGERERLEAELAGERERLEAELASERERLEAELASERERLEAELASERERLETLLDSDRAEQIEMTRRLALGDEELKTTIRSLTAMESTAASLEQAIVELRSETSELRAEKAGLTERADVLMLHGEGLALAVSERERREADARSSISALELEIERSRARVRSVQADLRGRDERLARLNAERRGRDERLAGLEAELRVRDAGLVERNSRVQELERERERTIEDLRRVAASRAWRWGHGTTLMLRRITFRHTLQLGAVEKLLGRLDPPAELPPGLPAPDHAEPDAPG